MATVERVKLINVRMGDVELSMLRDLVASTGLTQSDVIRQLVRRAHDELPSARTKPKQGRRFHQRLGAAP